MLFRRISLFVLLVLIAVTSPCASEQLPFPRHGFPKVGKYDVLCCDFHMHAFNSNLKITTRERVEESCRLGYDVIAITDHGNSRAYRVADYVGSGLGMIVLNGMETNLDATEHLNFIGMSPDYEKTPRKKWSETAGKDAVYYQDEMKRLKGYNGIIVYNHPNVEYEECVKWGVEHGLITGIEVKNDNVTNKHKTSDFQGTRCFPNAFDYALKNNLTIFADTDVHAYRDENPAKTLILVENRSPEAVLDAIKERRSIAWFGGMLWGREALLSQLIKSDVKLSGVAGGQVVLKNLGPVGLKGTIDGSGDKFEIAPYAETAIHSENTAESITILWDNIWTSSKTNLRTELPKE